MGRALQRICNVLLGRRELALGELGVGGGGDCRLEGFNDLLLDVEEVMMLQAGKLGKLRSPDRLDLRVHSGS